MWRVQRRSFDPYRSRYYLRKVKGDSTLAHAFYPETATFNDPGAYCDSLDHARLMCDVLNIRDYGRVDVES